MRSPSAVRLGSRVAPRAIEAIQVTAGTALLSSVCLLLATIMVPDLLLRGPAAQLASPSALAALLLLTASTVLLERELIVHGLIDQGHEADDHDDVGVHHVAPIGLVAIPAAAGVRVIALPETVTLRYAGRSDPPEPAAEPVDADPWWAPWMERGTRSVFDGAPNGRPNEPIVIDLSEDARSDQLAGAPLS